MQYSSVLGPVPDRRAPVICSGLPPLSSSLLTSEEKLVSWRYWISLLSDWFYLLLYLGETSRTVFGETCYKLANECGKIAECETSAFCTDWCSSTNGKLPTSGWERSLLSFRRGGKTLNTLRAHMWRHQCRPATLLFSCGIQRTLNRTVPSIQTFWILDGRKWSYELTALRPIHPPHAYMQAVPRIWYALNFFVNATCICCCVWQNMTSN